MRKRAATLLLAGVIARQHARIVRMETELGTYWSNRFSGGFFSRLNQMAAEMGQWAETGQVPPAEAERWWQGSHNMLAVVNNQWQEMRDIVPDLPERPAYLLGYLERVRDTVPRGAAATEPIALTEEQRTLFRRHAAAANKMIDALRAQYPGWTEGFPQDAGYFVRDFLRSPGWKKAITEMNRIAHEEGYPPAH